MPSQTESQQHTTHRAVKRTRAEHNLLLSLVAFAASVIVTRLYLQMTGYPQIGGGNIHIAHLLWGGILLYIAALLPLILNGSQALSWSAVLGGVGMGLFIDEVGKFITSNNDYFYPPAAPIIYAVFLLSVLLFLTVRRRGSNDMRAALFHALETVPDLIDGRLTKIEIGQLRGWLNIADESDDFRFSELSIALSGYLEKTKEQIAAAQPSLLTRAGRQIGRTGRKLGRPWHRRLVLFLTGLNGMQAIVGVISLVLLPRYAKVSGDGLPQLLVDAGEIANVNDVRWFSIGVFLQIAVGLIAIAGLVLILRKRELVGVKAATFSLLLSLTTVVLLAFYLNQFAAIATALGQFVSLLVVVSYRQWYLPDEPEQPGVNAADGA